MIEKFKKLFPDFLNILSNDKNVNEFVNEQSKLHGFKHRDNTKIKNDDKDIAFLNCDDKTNILNLLSIVVTYNYMISDNMEQNSLENNADIQLFSEWINKKVMNYKTIYGSFFDDILPNIEQFVTQNFDDFVQKYRSSDLVCDNKDSSSNDDSLNSLNENDQIIYKYLTIFQDFIYSFISIRPAYRNLIQKYQSANKSILKNMIVNSFVKVYLIRKRKNEIKAIANDPTNGKEDVFIKSINSMLLSDSKEIKDLINEKELQNDILDLIKKYGENCYTSLTEYIIEEYSKNW